eukprot:2142457-Rhodomonas_salina.1
MARQTVRHPCTAHRQDKMARQTVRHPPAQHTGLLKWPDKLSDASSTAHRTDRVVRQTVRHFQHSTLARWNGQTNCQT